MDIHGTLQRSPAPVFPACIICIADFRAGITANANRYFRLQRVRDDRSTLAVDKQRAGRRGDFKHGGVDHPDSIHTESGRGFIEQDALPC